MRKKAKVIMVQGTGSYVGKSVIVSALCRIFKQDGYRVAPFKAQNMALNSFVTLDGLEMGRAQVTQAEAAGIEPNVDMNPILLKPSGDVKAQVVVMGKPIGNMSGRQYYRNKEKLLKVVKDSFKRLSSLYDIVVIEGAGSPAEVNLRKNDLVNMKMAQVADCPVILAGDINVGGVFAWLVGTLELLNASERGRVKGFIINKFRGDIEILKPGLDFLEKRTKKPVLGVVPYYHNISIPEEDSIARERYPLAYNVRGKDNINIDVIYLPHISNFTDFDPLEKEPGINLRYVERAADLGEPDCIIIPGSKNAIDDLLYLKNSGLAETITRKVKNGAHIVGICGGYQMLGKKIKDPDSIESRRKAIEGLGLLPLTTIISRKKETHRIEGEDLLFGSGGLKGYEIHMGKSRLESGFKAVCNILKRSGSSVDIIDGAVTADKRVWGTYVHGLFDNDNFRRAFIDSLWKSRSCSFASKNTRSGNLSFSEEKEREYDKLADLFRDNLDMNKIYSILGR